MIFPVQLLASGWFNTNRDLVLLNAVLVVATLVVAGVGVKTIKSSNKVAASAERQAAASEKQTEATDATVTAAIEQLQLGRDQLKQEQATLSASIRPLIVEVPLGVYMTEGSGRLGMMSETDHGAIWFFGGDDFIRVTIPIRNVGNGPAFIVRSRLSGGVGLVFDAQVDHEVLPNNELAEITALIMSDRIGYSVIAQSLSLDVDILYSDLAGVQRTQSVIGIRRDAGDVFAQSLPGYVQKVDLYECDDHWIRGSRVVSTGAE